MGVTRALLSAGLSLGVETLSKSAFVEAADSLLQEVRNHAELAGLRVLLLGTFTIYFHSCPCFAEYLERNSVPMDS